MKLYAYVVATDSGFSPNPFWKICTLADCKPQIRKHASVGDWIVGISPRNKGNGNKLIYAMRIEKILPYEKYFTDSKYECKKPKFNTCRILEKRGDNIYRPLGGGQFKQLPSVHSLKNGEENLEAKAHDLSGQNVLISEDFYYFGREAIPLPDNLQEIKDVGRGHKCNFSQIVVDDFIKFIRQQKKGVNAPPAEWSAQGASCNLPSVRQSSNAMPADNSWKQQ